MAILCCLAYVKRHLRADPSWQPTSDLDFNRAMMNVAKRQALRICIAILAILLGALAPMRATGRGIRRLPRGGKVAITQRLNGDENTNRCSHRVTSNGCFWPKADEHGNCA